MFRLQRLLPVLFACGISACFAQTPILSCNATAVPPIVRGEGISERVGDIVLNCSGGQPNARIVGNFSIFLDVNVTNRVAGTTVSGIVFTTDNGSGPQPVATPGMIAGPGQLVYNGLTFTLSSTGTVSIRIANIRAAAIQKMLQSNAAIQAFISFNTGSLLSLNTSQLTVGTVARSLYIGNSGKIVCSQNGSLLPQNLTFTELLRSGAAYATTRVTEGFADALGPRRVWANFNADSAERIIVKYSGFPAGASLFVPDVVAGSDAVTPTGAGDLGVPASGGQYAPTQNGSLLLARVRFADANGAGGTPSYTPGLPGSGTVSFDSVSEVPLVNGAGVAVYEVVDANENVLESAQFPTFLGLAPNSVSASVTTSADVFLAPLSNVMIATPADPIPRFSPVAAPSDCSIVGDCSSNFFPRLRVDTTPLAFTAPMGSAYQIAYARVQNQGGGLLKWTASASYQNGTGWLRVTPDSGQNNGTIRVDVIPGTLPPGTYQGKVVVEAGSVAGSQTIPVSLVITAAPLPPVFIPLIDSVVNAASLKAGPVVAGSLATVRGKNFGGKNLGVTFDGLPATLLFSNPTQINLLVPAELSGKTSTQMVITADNISSAAQKVDLASAAPAIFPGAVLNQDYSPNSATNPAGFGAVIQVFATGLPGPGAITARIHDRDIDVPYYAGPAPGLPGVQQVDLVVPLDLPAMTTDVYVCGWVGDQKVCSAPAPVTISEP